ERQHLADTEHERLMLGLIEQSVLPLTDCPARVAHQRARLRRRDDQDPMPASRELLGNPRDVVVHLVRSLPRKRGHLRDCGALVHAMRIDASATWPRRRASMRPWAPGARTSR